VVAHFVLGAHRRIVWGLDLALLVTLVRQLAPRCRQHLSTALRAPWRIVEALTARRLFAALVVLGLLSLALAYPPLLSLGALPPLAWLWWWTTRPGREKLRAEDGHAR
jgi:hypothetical protein